MDGFICFGKTLGRIEWNRGDENESLVRSEFGKRKIGKLGTLKNNTKN